MISVGQLASALYGLWLLLKLDHRAFAYFEKTPEGFARSFLVAAAIAPFQATHIILVYPPKARLPFGPYLVVHMLEFVLEWGLFPFAMLYISQLLGRQARYFWQMVPYNWLQLAIDVPLLSCAILADLHLIAPRPFAFLNLLALSVFFVYASFITRTGLQVGIGTAFGVTLLDLILNMITSQVVGRI